VGDGLDRVTGIRRHPTGDGARLPRLIRTPEVKQDITNGQLIQTFLTPDRPAGGSGRYRRYCGWFGVRLPTHRTHAGRRSFDA
jgi:hypothetical protein